MQNDSSIIHNISKITVDQLRLMLLEDNVKILESNDYTLVRVIVGDVHNNNSIIMSFDNDAVVIYVSDNDRNKSLTYYYADRDFIIRIVELIKNELVRLRS